MIVKSIITLGQWRDSQQDETDGYSKPSSTADILMHDQRLMWLILNLTLLYHMVEAAEIYFWETHQNYFEYTEKVEDVITWHSASE